MEKRQRSPNYPAIGLREAIEKVRALHSAIGQSAHDRDVVARGMGYRSLSGASATAISALKKYGLLDGRNEDIHVTDRAMSILFSHSEEERIAALQASAMEPDLFRELSGKFPNQMRLNDDLLKNYLVRNGFAVNAVDGVISAYKETIEFVQQESGGYDSAKSTTEGAEEMHTSEHVPMQPAKPAPSVVDGAQRLLARYDFEGGGNVEVRVTGNVDTDAALDMIETLIELKRKEIERRRVQAKAIADEEN